MREDRGSIGILDKVQVAGSAYQRNRQATRPEPATKAGCCEKTTVHYMMSCKHYISRHNGRPPRGRQSHPAIGTPRHRCEHPGQTTGGEPHRESDPPAPREPTTTGDPRCPADTTSPTDHPRPGPLPGRHAVEDPLPRKLAVPASPCRVPIGYRALHVGTGRPLPHRPRLQRAHQRKGTPQEAGTRRNAAPDARGDDLQRPRALGRPGRHLRPDRAGAGLARRAPAQAAAPGA